MPYKAITIETVSGANGVFVPEIALFMPKITFSVFWGYDIFITKQGGENFG